MRNIKLIIEYDGTGFCGWQKQRPKRTFPINKNYKISIQETMETCLKKILKQAVSITASGRTDSGVHAFGQVANFKTASKISPERLRMAFNANLPKEIRVTKAEEASLKFHARYSAKSKTYHYLILNQGNISPFLKDYSFWFKQPLDIRLMRKAAKSLLGKHDFKAFCASGSSINDTKRTVKHLSINKLKSFSGNLISIEIEADGFLRNMVRNIIGTLIEIGRKRFSLDCIKKIISGKDRLLAGPCVPAKGLYLIKVNY